MARRFIDTNVLVYAEDPGAGERGARAVEVVARLMANGEGVVSTQVLQEFFVITTKKLGLKARAMRARLETFEAFDLVPVTRERIYEAIELQARVALSFWDALVVRCAAASKCSELLTEDLQSGRTVDRVRIVDPFA